MRKREIAYTMAVVLCYAVLCCVVWLAFTSHFRYLTAAHTRYFYSSNQTKLGQISPAVEARFIRSPSFQTGFIVFVLFLYFISFCFVFIHDFGRAVSPVIVSFPCACVFLLWPLRQMIFAIFFFPFRVSMYCMQFAVCHNAVECVCRSITSYASGS